MIQDWKKEIAVGWLVKQAMMELDKHKVFPYHLPEVAASESQILEAERQIGHTLDASYKAFLRHANGWQSFWQTSDLFGTDDLIRGKRKDNGEFSLSMLDEGVIAKCKFKRQDLLPISVTPFDRDVFVITRPNSPSPGIVIWFAGEEVERFLTFDDYFLAMVEYGRQNIQWLKDHQQSNT
jgi:hypothetical protein